jgi:hypothetical protein
MSRCSHRAAAFVSQLGHSLAEISELLLRKQNAFKTKKRADDARSMTPD